MVLLCRNNATINAHVKTQNRVKHRVWHTDPWSDQTWPKSLTRWPGDPVPSLPDDDYKTAERHSGKSRYDRIDRRLQRLRKTRIVLVGDSIFTRTGLKGAKSFRRNEERKSAVMRSLVTATRRWRPTDTWYLLLPPPRRLCFRSGLCVCVCPAAKYLRQIWTNLDEIFWTGQAWPKYQWIRFWWRCGSRSGSTVPGLRFSPDPGMFLNEFFRAKLHYTDTGYEHHQRTPPTDELTTNSPPTDKNLPHPNICTCRDVGLWHCDVANLL